MTNSLVSPSSTVVGDGWKKKKKKETNYYIEQTYTNDFQQRLAIESMLKFSVLIMFIV